MSWWEWLLAALMTLVNWMVICVVVDLTAGKRTIYHMDGCVTEATNSLHLTAIDKQLSDFAWLLGTSVSLGFGITVVVSALGLLAYLL